MKRTIDVLVLLLANHMHASYQFLIWNFDLVFEYLQLTNKSSYEIIKLQDLLAKNSFTNIGSVIRYRDFTSFLKSINNKFRATSPSFLCCYAAPHGYFYQNL